MIFEARRCSFPREVSRFAHWAKWCCVAVFYGRGNGGHLDVGGKKLLSLVVFKDGGFSYIDNG